MASKAVIRTTILSVVFFLIGIAIGVLAGYFGKPAPPPPPAPQEVTQATSGQLNDLPAGILREANPDISKLLLDEVKADKIRQNLRDFSSKPHPAGTDANKELAEEIKKMWLEQGMDRVDINKYNVLLSYPKEGDPNTITLIQNGTTRFTSQPEEKVLRQEDVKPGDKIVPPFHAYSPSGDVTTQKLFYVNYGREEDFYWLKTNRTTDFTDSIVIARYGKIFRGDKVVAAAKYGAKAIIIYSDPFDFSSSTDDTTYPDSWWLPGSGVQRGSVITGATGDPLTPLYPSLDSAYRVDPTPNLPQIPSHPIGYDDAKELLDKLTGEEVPESWKGSVSGVTYKFGGTFADSKLSIKAHVTTDTVRKDTYNVIGYIEGAIEPDRYVVVGNHRDAWVYGALDPSSGTAAMLEVSRAILSVMKSANWRPRRTIVFCSWAAEEHSLIGSTEFVEHFAKVLGQRAVAYLNADVLLEGMDFMEIRASPSLHQAVFNAAKKVPNPNPDEVEAGRATAYDTWLHKTQSEHSNLPEVVNIGAGSDYSSFQNVLGIPCLEPSYTWDKKKWKISSYPLYHSVYETFYLVDHIMDPGFKIFRAVTQAWTELVRDVSDSMILPLDATSFSNFISTESKKLLDFNEKLMKANNMTEDIKHFNTAKEEFAQTVANFVDSIKTVKKSNPYAVREVNDKLMNLHRSFLDPEGLPGRKMFKNVLLAPSQFNTYAGSVFPAITDSLHQIEVNIDPDKWEKVRKNMSIVTYMLHTAASTLRKASEFSKV